MANIKKRLAKRTKNLAVPVNPAEERLFKELAESRHSTFAQVVRELLYREAESLRKSQAA